MFQSFFYPFQTLLRYHARGFVCFKSSPFTSIANSSARIVTLRTFSASGQRKRPFSRRFAHTHNPLPSHTKAFSRVFVLLVNKNKCPLNGSCPRWSHTNPCKPSNPLRMSTASTDR